MTESITYVVKDNGKRKLPFNEDRLRKAIKRDVGDLDEEIVGKIIRTIKQRDERSSEYIQDLIVQELVAEIDIDKAEYTYKAAKAYNAILRKQVSKLRGYDIKDTYLDFNGLVEYGIRVGVYDAKVFDKYSKDELTRIGMMIKDRDDLFDYVGLKLLAERYLSRTHDKELFELPQERWLVIALTLMQDEAKDKRLELINEAYWALSNLYMTVATPTLANAGKTHGQLASCNIETMGDSLDSIMTVNHNIARQSKDGAGWGLYIGKLRGSGSSIKGFKGLASGPLPFTKITDAVAVAFDQLGTRNGSIAVYQDVWHRDINAHLDMKLNNGDERLRNYNLFHGVNIPDVFMRQLAITDEDGRSVGKWYLFDPYEIEQVKGYRLEDCFDETTAGGTFTDRYWECVNDDRITKKEVRAMDIMRRILRSQLETGSPFMFYRDTVNRANPNKHEGMIYSSNLCTEIAQNMSPSAIVEETVEDGLIVRTTKPGDLVTCNLSSLNLGRLYPFDDDLMSRVINIQVRMLDNVVDLNEMSVKEAEVTGQRYRAIGAGKFGTHHALALAHIKWESDEAVAFVDELEEKISYHTIKASMNLAKEKGAYPLFKGSDWENGAHLGDRNYVGDNTVVGEDKWKALQEDITAHGLRNGYLQAPAPNASTATIAGSTPASDPIFKTLHYEEKKNYRLPVIAPDLDHNTYPYYTDTAYTIDQFWSVKQNAARQRHIDQAISFNLYVPKTIKASILLDLHLRAWESGVKTNYYVRSTALNVEECEWCAG